MSVPASRSNPWKRHENSSGTDRPGLADPLARLRRPGRLSSHQLVRTRPPSPTAHSLSPVPSAGVFAAPPGPLERSAAEDQALHAVAVEQHEARGRQLQGALRVRN